MKERECNVERGEMEIREMGEEKWRLETMTEAGVGHT
jgi:hypothetical protein